tara:strand:+ start:21699 stop:23312 length:1614 start_codon:yes stop_codon:yes gene_type:complete
MKINSIKIENFLSVQKAEIDFEDFSELVRVVGVNADTNPKSSNGAGKSTIIEAIAFSLFGKTIRKTNEKSLTNVHATGKCKVTITVNDTVVIERTKKPPMLTVLVDGENCTKDNIQHTQKYLENFLNINPSVFLASVVFGQGNSTNFLTSTAEEKRTIIQSFLNVSDLFRERSKIKTLKSAYTNEKKVALTLSEDATKSLEKLKEKKKTLIKLGKKVDSLFSSEKAHFIRKHSLLEIQEKERTYREIEMERKTLALQLAEEIRNVERTRERIKNNKDMACEHCGKVSLGAWERIKEDEQRVTKLGHSIESKGKELTQLDQSLEENHIPVSLKDFESIEEAKMIETELKFLKEQADDQIKTCTKYKRRIERSQKEYDLMRFWETAFSEQGLVRYIIRNILSFFNERSNYYLGFLTNGNFTITFSEVLQDEIKNKGVELAFDALSGGEKKKVSLAVMLALNDLLLLTGKDRSNVVFFDEIADSLDDEGIKGLYELIQQITGSKRLFVITHNEYLNSLIEDWSDILLVRKKNYVSTIRKI